MTFGLMCVRLLMSAMLRRASRRARASVPPMLTVQPPFAAPARWMPQGRVMWLPSWRLLNAGGSRFASRTPNASLRRALAYFYQVAIRITDIGADLAAVVLRLGQELRAPRRPLLVTRADVRDSDVDERTHLI